VYSWIKSDACKLKRPWNCSIPHCFFSDETFSNLLKVFGPGMLFWRTCESFRWYLQVAPRDWWAISIFLSCYPFFFHIHCRLSICFCVFFNSALKNYKKWARPCKNLWVNGLLFAMYSNVKRCSNHGHWSSWDEQQKTGHIMKYLWYFQSVTLIIHVTRRNLTQIRAFSRKVNRAC